MPAEENSFQVAFNAAAAVEQEFGELIYSYTIYCETEVFHVQEDADDTWDALSAAEKRAASYRIPVALVEEFVIPCRKVSIIGASGNGTAYIKIVPMQSNQAIPDEEVYEYRAVYPAMR